MWVLWLLSKLKNLVVLGLVKNSNLRLEDMMQTELNHHIYHKKIKLTREHKDDLFKIQTEKMAQLG